MRMGWWRMSLRSPRTASRRSSSSLMDERSAAASSSTDAISVRTDPKGSGEVSGQAMGHAKSGQGPMIRDVLKSTCRLAHRGGFLFVLLPSHLRVSRSGDVGSSRVWAGAGAPTAVLSSRAAVFAVTGHRLRKGPRRPSRRYGNAQIRRSDSTGLR
jgi:hypothetical protein